MSNPDLQDIQTESVNLKAEKTLLEGKFNFMDGQFETISRVITRRGQERQRPTI